MLRLEIRAQQIVCSRQLASILFRSQAARSSAASFQYRSLSSAPSSLARPCLSRIGAVRCNTTQSSSAKPEDKKEEKAELSDEQKAEVARQEEAIVKSALGTGQVDVETGLPAKPSKSEKKLTLWEKVKKEAAHYRDGTKLLIFEVKSSFKLALKMAAGHELSRREWRQFKRTVQDLLRLVPFSAFVIVPFAELLLPVALKIFPNMLPSTYEGAKAKEAKAQKLTTTREGVSGFLRKTIQESGLPLSATTKQREEFVAFFKKVRSSAVSPTHEDIVKVCRIFKDDLTLDNLSRPQLVAMCRYMNLSSFGTDTLLRYNIRHRMRQIKRDDKAIAYEGVPSLSVPELHAACQSRGIRTQGSSPGHLRDELKQWLDLRLKHRVPSTLLILSNAFSYGHNDGKPESFYDALVATLSSLPEELYHEAELEVSSMEGHATNRQRLDVLKEQAELIEEEAEQDKESKTRVSDREDLDKEDEPETMPLAAEGSEKVNEEGKARQ